jgi:hypothetical protein
MEVWQFALAFGGLLTPVIIAAFARDRQLLNLISQAKDDAKSVAELAKQHSDDRINRVRDEYVRRDDLDGHLVRIDRRLAEIRDDSRRDMEQLAGELREIKQLINLLAGVVPGKGPHP